MNTLASPQARTPRQPARSGVLQRKPEEANCSEPTGRLAPPIVHEVLRSAGQPLDPATRAYMESRFGHDFSNVRVHSDSQAMASARAVNALAYTVGKDVVFGDGHYRPSSAEGRHLIAHELTHFDQQDANGPVGARLHVDRSAAAESEANEQASHVVAGNGAPVRLGRRRQALQRAAGPKRTSAGMSLEESVRNLAEFEHDEALAVLKRYILFVSQQVDSGEHRIRDLMALRAESFTNYLIGGTVEIFGWTSLPSDNWVEPEKFINASWAALKKQDIAACNAAMTQAVAATAKHWTILQEYLASTESGAERAIFTLHVLEAAGAVAATALTGGGATAIAVGGGYAATQNLAGQATSVSIGIQDNIDWSGVIFDTLFGALTGMLGGKLGNAVLKKLVRNPAVASLGRKALAEVVTDLISGRLSSILQTTARALFDQLRGRENLTVDQFIDRLSDQLMDPKAMLLDAIMGRASKMAHASKSTPANMTKSTANATAADLVAPPTTRAPEPATPSAAKSAAPPESVSSPTASNSPPKVDAPVEHAAPPAPKPAAKSAEIAAPKADTVTTTPHEPAPASKAATPPEGSGLELDKSGAREGWNKHVDEHQVRDETKLSAETKKPGFGDASTEKGGTEHHTGMNFREYSPAEVAIGLRVDWDPQAGRPRKVTYNFTAEAAAVPSQATDRSFHQEQRLKGESAQSREKAYVKSGQERGHVAQREAGKVDPKIDAALGLKPTGPEVERSLDVLTNVVPMTPTLNKGTPWRSAETRTAQLATREGYVTVEITPIYDAKPKRLSDGTPIPTQVRRVIKSGPTGKILEDLTFDNK